MVPLTVSNFLTCKFRKASRMFEKVTRIWVAGSIVLSKTSACQLSDSYDYLQQAQWLKFSSGSIVSFIISRILSIRSRLFLACVIRKLKIVKINLYI